MTDAELAVATAQRTIAESLAPIIDADTLATLLDRVAEVPYPGDMERYFVVVAEVTKTTMQPWADRLAAENARWRAFEAAAADRAWAFVACWFAETSSTIH